MLLQPTHLITIAPSKYYVAYVYNQDSHISTIRVFHKYCVIRLSLTISFFSNKPSKSLEPSTRKLLQSTKGFLQLTHISSKLVFKARGHTHIYFLFQFSIEKHIFNIQLKQRSLQINSYKVVFECYLVWLYEQMSLDNQLLRFV